VDVGVARVALADDDEVGLNSEHFW
jgi:hypothetical protein